MGWLAVVVCFWVAPWSRGRISIEASLSTVEAAGWDCRIKTNLSLLPVIHTVDSTELLCIHTLMVPFISYRCFSCACSKDTKLWRLSGSCSNGGHPCGPRQYIGQTAQWPLFVGKVPRFPRSLHHDFLRFRLCGCPLPNRAGRLACCWALISSLVFKRSDASVSFREPGCSSQERAGTPAHFPGRFRHKTQGIFAGLQRAWTGHYDPLRSYRIYRFSSKRPWKIWLLGPILASLQKPWPEAIIGHPECVERAAKQKPGTLRANTYLEGVP